MFLRFSHKDDPRLCVRVPKRQDFQTKDLKRAPDTGDEDAEWGPETEEKSSNAAQHSTEQYRRRRLSTAQHIEPPCTEPPNRTLPRILLGLVEFVTRLDSDTFGWRLPLILCLFCSQEHARARREAVLGRERHCISGEP